MSEPIIRLRGLSLYGFACEGDWHKARRNGPNAVWTMLADVVLRARDRPGCFDVNKCRATETFGETAYASILRAAFPTMRIEYTNPDHPYWVNESVHLPEPQIDIFLKLHFG